MTTNWKGGDGDWQTAANWTNGAPTTPAAFAVINAAGTYTVTIGTGLEYHVGAIRLNAADGKLAINGILDLTNKLTLSQGKLSVTGTINGGTISAAGGKTNFQNATLNGTTILSAGGTIKMETVTLDKVIYGGTLDLSTTQTLITVKDGLTLTGANGKGLGALVLGGESSIHFIGNQRFNGGTVTMTGGQLNITSGILTFGRKLTVLYKSPNTVLTGIVPLINQGSINIGKGSTLSDQGQVSNQGQIFVNGGSFGASAFRNVAGASITLGAGSSFGAGGFDNKGTLTADGATLNLNLAKGAADFGTLDVTNSKVTASASTTDAIDEVIDALANHNNDLTVSFASSTSFGGYDNTGKTLTLDAPSGFKSFTYSGNIEGGTVKAGTAAFSGSLSTLTLEGTLNTQDIAISNVVFTGAGGAGRGAIDLHGNLSLFNAAVDNVDIAAQAGSAIVIQENTFTLGPDFSVETSGNFALHFNRDTPQQLTNDGVLEADGGPGTTFTLVANHFTNNGTLKVENGGTFLFETRPDSFINISDGTLTGGTYDIGAHSTLKYSLTFLRRIYPGDSIQTLQATVILEGSGAVFTNLAGLSTIGAMGSLSLENGATLSVGSPFSIAGILNLDGGNFTSADITIASGGSLNENGAILSAVTTSTNITIASGGSLNGNGTILGAVANSGLIDASGEILSIGQDVAGTGQSKIEAGATLEFGSDASAGQTVTFESTTGTLALGNAGGFAGTITGFAQGDTIDLINTKAGSVVYHAANDTLSVKFQGNIIATLQLSGDYTGDTFGVASDGNGGTAITLTGVAPGALQRFTEARAAFAPTSMASTGSNLLPDSSLQSSALAASAGTHFGHA